MKRDLKRLFEEVGRKAHLHSGKSPQHSSPDFERMSSHLLHHNVNLSSASLKWLWELLTGKRHLSLAAKNRLALFAGFQNWADLDDALHGDADASINYDDKPEQ